jgi:hypothetical protein
MAKGPTPLGAHMSSSGCYGLVWLAKYCRNGGMAFALSVEIGRTTIAPFCPHCPGP